MVEMLLGLVAGVPDDGFLEAPGHRVVRNLPDVHADDPLERVQHGAGAQPLDGIRPVRAVAEVDGIVITIGKTEPEQQPSRGVHAERIHQLLAQQPHRRGAQDHDPLIVQPDHPLVGAEIHQLGQVQICGTRRRGGRRALHDVLIVGRAGDDTLPACPGVHACST
jgi:hypothetical protein